MRQFSAVAWTRRAATAALRLPFLPMLLVWRWALRLVGSIPFLRSSLRFINEQKFTWLKWAAALVITVNVTMVSAVLVYVLLYLLYMPNVYTRVPVHFDFRETEPSTSFDLTMKNGVPYSFFSRWQEYDISIELSMPESDPNSDHGMFTIVTDIFSRNSTLLSSTVRPCIMHYKSSLHRVLQTVFYSMPLLVGWAEEKQDLSVQLVAKFVDSMPAGSDLSASEAVIRLSSSVLQVYSSWLVVEARLTYIGYFFHRWFVTSSLVAVVSIFVLEWVVLLTAVIIFSLSVASRNAAADESDILLGDERRRSLSRQRRGRMPSQVVPIGSIRSRSGSGSSRGGRSGVVGGGGGGGGRRRPVVGTSYSHLDDDDYDFIDPSDSSPPLLEPYSYPSVAPGLLIDEADGDGMPQSDSGDEDDVRAPKSGFSVADAEIGDEATVDEQIEREVDDFKPGTVQEQLDRAISDFSTGAVDADERIATALDEIGGAGASDEEIAFAGGVSAQGSALEIALVVGSDAAAQVGLRNRSKRPSLQSSSSSTSSSTGSGGGNIAGPPSAP